MATQNIESYVRWRGDLDFATRPFTHLDNLVLCKLAYCDFSPVPGTAGSGGLTLAACSCRLSSTPVHTNTDAATA